MIIKRWNTGTSSWDEEYPKTKAQLIRNNANTDWIFDGSDKIKPAYLPDSVFDSLYFAGTTVGAVGTVGPRGILASALITAYYNADSLDRSIIGFYWVISSTGTITGLTGTQATLILNGEPGYQEYATLQFRPQDAGSSGTANTSSSTLEVGDWFVIESVTGNGTSGTPFVFTASVINNSYEIATTTVNGVVRLSDQTVYASLAGNDVVTEGILKGVIDDAGFAAGNHVHGNISNTGTINTNTAASSGQHLVITSTADLVQQSAITFGSTTTTFLTNAGTWATPTGTYAHPTQTAINANATDDGINVIDSVTVNTLGHVTAVGTRNLSAATTSAPGHMTAADKTKLDGIATGANAYVHPTQALTQAAGTETTLTDITLVDSLTTNSTGHLTNATWRKLIAGDNVTITAASNGNITIASTDTNTTYTATDGLVLDGTNIEMVYPLFVQTATPSNPKASSVWLDIN